MFGRARLAEDRKLPLTRARKVHERLRPVACVRACVHACMRACVGVCVTRTCEPLQAQGEIISSPSSVSVERQIRQQGLSLSSKGLSLSSTAAATCLSADIEPD